MSDDSERWDSYADGYNEQVYSITSVAEKRARIIEALEEAQRILIVGCGSETHLQRHILEVNPDAQIVAADFNERMLEVARADFAPSNVEYAQRDTRSLDYEEEFDVVISTNSILPETRAEVKRMYASIHGALKQDGKFIAFHPSFTCAQEATEIYPQYAERLDQENRRCFDTGYWQCFHTRELIFGELASAGFQDVQTTKVGVENEEEREKLVDLYGVGGNYFWEFFTEARKGERVLTASAPELPDPFTVHTIPFEQIRENPELIEAISDFYRYVFNNENGHYLVYPSKLEFIPPSQHFKQEGKDYVGLDKMDSITEFPIDPATEEEAVFWHDPSITTERMQEKFDRDGYITYITGESGEILGVTFGYFATLREVFTMEGWEDPLYYAKREVDQDDPAFETFNRSINDLLKRENSLSSPTLTPDSEVFCYNCIAIAPTIQGASIFWSLVHNLFKSIPVEKRHLLALTETQIGTRAFKISTSRGLIPVPGALGGPTENQGQPRSILFVSELDNWVI